MTMKLLTGTAVKAAWNSWKKATRTHLSGGSFLSKDHKLSRVPAGEIEIPAQAAAHSKASISACRMVHVPDAFVHGISGEQDGLFPLVRYCPPPLRRKTVFAWANASDAAAPTSQEFGDE